MANENRDFDAFIRHISELDIELSVNDEGIFTVCTHAEPFFCYDASSQQEAAELVGRTLASYGRAFFGLEGLKEPTVKTVEDRVPLAIERSTRLSQLKPVFDLAA